MCETKYQLVSKINTENQNSLNTERLFNEISNILNNMKKITSNLKYQIKKIENNKIKHENSLKYYLYLVKDFITTNPFTYLEKEDYMILPVIWFGSYSIVYMYRNWNNLL